MIFVYTTNRFWGKIFLSHAGWNGLRALQDARLTPLKRFPPGWKNGMILAGQDTMVSNLAGCREN
jgi:hypothetical protein